MDLSNLLEVPADLSDTDFDGVPGGLLFGKSMHLLLSYSVFTFLFRTFMHVYVFLEFFFLWLGVCLNMGCPKLSSILWENRVVVVYWLWGESVSMVIEKLMDQ